MPRFYVVHERPEGPVPTIQVRPGLWRTVQETKILSHAEFWPLYYSDKPPTFRKVIEADTIEEAEKKWADQSGGSGGTLSETSDPV